MTVDPARTLLGERVPGQAVVEELLALQNLKRPRSFLERIFGASPLSPGSWPWYKGALGEIAVGRILAGLGPDWLVLHAVPVGTGSTDIDHVLVGPAGVFTINTKNHSGQSVWVAGRTLMVAGTKTRHLYNSAHEAARASKLLSTAVGAEVHVTGVVVIVEPKTLTIKARSEQVAVVTERQLLGWLNRCSHKLGPEEVARNGSAASWFGTQILGIVITICTIGICYPFAVVLVERWRAKNTYLYGRQLQFVGTGWGIFGMWIKWLLLSIITLGIYTFWVYPRLMQWKVEKTVYA